MKEALVLLIACSFLFACNKERSVPARQSPAAANLVFPYED